MAITSRPRRSKLDEFTAAAPDAKPEPKLRGHRQPIAFTLPPDLIAAVDRIAARDDRSRAKMIEIALRRFVQEEERATAAPE